MVAMIGELVAKGHAYAAEGHVLFSVRERSRIMARSAAATARR